MKLTTRDRAILSPVFALALAVALGVGSPSFAQEPGAAPAQTNQAPASEIPADPVESSAPEQPGQTTVLETDEAFVPPGVDRSALPHDLSPWGMFMQADIVVKLVMVSLVFASILTWTVWLGKTIELLGAKRRLARTLDVLKRATSLHDAEKILSAERGPAADLVRAARSELSASADLPGDGIKERVSTALSRIEIGAGRSMAVGTGLLATMGSTAPFVGLFGTVWGIMNSFIGISQSQTTNLAVVAPGIAEALLATALGLIVAIPAVVIYNAFARAIAGYRAGLGDASASVMRLLSRDLDRESLAVHEFRPHPERASMGRAMMAE